MISNILSIGSYFLAFSALDTILTRLRYQGVYYGIHALHNAIIVFTTYSDVWITITDFSSLANRPMQMLPMQLCFALHFYHIAYYWKKFRMDDWLHHILMIGIALPIGLTIECGPLLGYNLFFSTGLPGGIDYLLLFLNRNNYLVKATEKHINTILQVWVRSPGILSHAVFTYIYISSVQFTALSQFVALVVVFLDYWNAQYFMQQVVLDAGFRNIILPY